VLHSHDQIVAHLYFRHKSVGAPQMVVSAFGKGHGSSEMGFATDALPAFWQLGVYSTRSFTQTNPEPRRLAIVTC